MFSKLNITSIALLILLQTSFSFATQNWLSEDQVKKNKAQVLGTIFNGRLTIPEKIEFSKGKVTELENQIQNGIITGSIDPKDIAKPESAIAKAFELLDILLIISELQTDTNGQTTSESCNYAQALLDLKSTQAGENEFKSLNLFCK